MINLANQPPTTMTWVILVCSVVAVSSAGAVFQLIDEVPPLLRASWRLQLTSLLLLPLFLYQYVKFKNDEPDLSEKLYSKEVIVITLFSGICLWIHFGSWVWSLDQTSLTHSLLFVTAHPLVIVIGMLVLRKSITRLEMSGAVVGFVGAAITLLGVTNEGEVSLLGDFAAFVGAVAIVGYLAAGRTLRKWVPLFVYAFPVTLVASILLAISSIFLEGTSVIGSISVSSTIGWADLVWLPAIVYLAIFPGIVGHMGINGVLKYLNPLVISVAVLFEPLLGSVIGWFLGTSSIPGLFTWVGGIFLIGGVILVTLGQEGVSVSDSVPPIGEFI